VVLSHADISNGNTQAENLLELELDGALDVVDLLGQIFGVGYRSGELSSLGQTGAEETRDLLDELLGGDEGVILAGELLDELLVLVKLLQVVNRHGLEVVVLRTIDVVLVSKDTDGHVWSGNLRQLDSSGETLVTHGVIVLESNLELNGLEEVPLLLICGVFQ